MTISKKIPINISFDKEGLNKELFNKFKNKTITAENIQKFIVDREVNAYDENYSIEIDDQIDYQTGYCHTGYSVSSIKDIKETKDSFKVSFTIDVDLDIDKEESTKESKKKKEISR